MFLVRPPAPFVADARCAGLLEAIGFSYDAEKNDADPWSVPSDSDSKVWWKSSVGPSLLASPRRLMTFAKKINM
jgi:hypothetical protein